MAAHFQILDPQRPCAPEHNIPQAPLPGESREWFQVRNIQTN
jgi:hypothetical protein